MRISRITVTLTRLETHFLLLSSSEAMNLHLLFFFTLWEHFYVVLIFAQVTQLPYDPSPFATTGYITGSVSIFNVLNHTYLQILHSATLNNASDILSGGTLTLSGVHNVVIPRNLLVNTPSLTAVAWRELFKADGTIDLPLWPAVNWEASV